MKRKSKIATGILLLLVVGGALACYQGWQRRGRAHAAGGLQDSRPTELVDVQGDPETIRITPAGMRSLQIETVEVKPAPPPEPLRLTGTLMLDPDRLVRIHARFPAS